MNTIIEELLNKYFEGETSGAEEQQLRDFFASDDVPEYLKMYRPMFAYFNQEIEKEKEKPILTIRPNPRKVIYLISGIAAGLLILLGIGRLWLFPGNTFCSDNYVIINGRCYTDKQIIQNYAFEALQEVSTSTEEISFFHDEEEKEHELFKNQLKELGNLFNEDE